MGTILFIVFIIVLITMISKGNKACHICGRTNSRYIWKSEEHPGIKFCTKKCMNVYLKKSKEKRKPTPKPKKLKQVPKLTIPYKPVRKLSNKQIKELKENPNDTIQNIGKIGEYLVQKHLIDKGYTLAKFDSHTESSIDTILPQMIPRIHCGSECGLGCFYYRNFDEYDYKTFSWKETIKGYTKWINYSLDKPLSSVSRVNFFRLNLIVDNYIKAFTTVEAKALKMHPYLIRTWNRKKIPENIFNEYRGHPGRFDMLGFRDNKYCVIEVKTNSGKLSFWQKVRLGLLQELGINIMVIYVSISKEKIEAILNGETPSYDDIRIEKNGQEVGDLAYVIDTSKIEYIDNKAFTKFIEKYTAYIKREDRRSKQNIIIWDDSDEDEIEETQGSSSTTSNFKQFSEKISDSK